ncbi:retroviral-like aspartic protease family protein [Salegentibacter mishustinae]|uniref:retroviral-like aspartic protease family protein n=1 Tax=Salegentibacter mishustinae TaxID=270918 RepID=UPI00248F73FB|nr:aspartyl protease family protein [Salegentibacter mishustinae]
MKKRTISKIDKNIIDRKSITNLKLIRVKTIKMRNKIFYLLLFLSSTVFSQELILPYAEQEGWPIIQVEINNRNYKFLFDTGAGITVVNSNTIKNLAIIENIETRDINKTIENIPVSILPKLKIGAKTFSEQKVAYKSLESLNMNFCELQLDGIIGIDIMKGFLIEVNTQERVIEFHNKNSFDLDELKGFSKNKYKHDIPTIKLKIDRQKRYASFDTGSNGDLTLSDYKLSDFINDNKNITSIGKGSLGINSSQDKIINHEFINENIEFGDLSLKDQNFTLNNQSQNNIGFDFIKQFNFFLDVSDKIIYLKKHSDFNVPESNISKYGFWIFYNFDAKNYYVSTIVDTNGQLKIGDVLLKINDIELPQEYCELSTFLKKHMEKNMTIHIERNGKESVVKYNYS